MKKESEGKVSSFICAPFAILMESGGGEQDISAQQFLFICHEFHLKSQIINIPFLLRLSQKNVLRSPEPFPLPRNSKKKTISFYTKFISSFRVKVYKHYKTVYDYDLSMFQDTKSGVARWRIFECTYFTLNGKLDLTNVGLR